MTGDILDRFCTPPETAATDYDLKAVAEARRWDLPFAGHRLRLYAWGEGEPVLLVHGWGSRASHLAPLARVLARGGCRAVAFDGPAHGDSLKPDGRQRSTMFEFGRAVRAVAESLPPLHGVVGHSLGAVAAAFVVAGHGRLADARVATRRLVLLAAPVDVARMIQHFCRRAGEEGRAAELTRRLEEGYGFAAPDYTLPAALGGAAAEILIGHDEEDEEVPVADAHALRAARPDAALVLTRGAGHQRILAHRTMLRAVADFLAG
jgi:pimeloyl-ACP methyl ester carboxylesterase